MKVKAQTEKQVCQQQNLTIDATVMSLDAIHIPMTASFALHFSGSHDDNTDIIIIVTQRNNKAIVKGRYLL